MVYELSDVPASLDGSRFHLGTSPGGFAVDAAENIGRAYWALAGRRRAGQPSAAAPLVKVKLFAAARTAEGVKLVPRGWMLKSPELVSTRPGKIDGGIKPSCSLLDDLMLGGDAWAKATDRACWESLRMVAERHGLQGEGLRLVNAAVAIAICARAGLSVREAELARIGSGHDEAV